jgi:hypothetical protein|nr:MAG TPA: hypothetical protein [Caudoviricetes sp.]
MQYYKSLFTGRILTQNELNILDAIYGKGNAQATINVGTVEKIDPPSVVDCIKYASSEAVAAFRYREINNCKLADATKAVREIKARMKRNKK